MDDSFDATAHMILPLTITIAANRKLKYPLVEMA